MKKFIIILIFLLSFSLFAEGKSKKNDNFFVPKYQSIAIGQLSLAYRLMTLSTSLSIAKAVDDDYIISILDNVDSTIKNCSNIVEADNGKKDEISKLIVETIAYFVSCSKSVKDYTALHSYENLKKVRTCIDKAGKYVDELTELHNKKVNKSKKKPKK